MQEFQVGDRVRTVSGVIGGEPMTHAGVEGVVVVIWGDGYNSVGVCFDEDIGGHDFFGHVPGCYPKGHCWYCNRDELEVIEFDPADLPDEDSLLGFLYG